MDQFWFLVPVLVFVIGAIFLLKKVKAKSK